MSDVLGAGFGKALVQAVCESLAADKLRIKARSEKLGANDVGMRCERAGEWRAWMLACADAHRAQAAESVATAEALEAWLHVDSIITQAAASAVSTPAPDEEPAP